MLITMQAMHQSIPAVPIPPGNPGAFAHVASPGGGAFAIISHPWGWAFAYPGAFETHVFESAMEEFICKDEAFVEDWLILSSMQLERDQEAKIAAKGVLDIT